MIWGCFLHYRVHGVPLSFLNGSMFPCLCVRYNHMKKVVELTIHIYPLFGHRDVAIGTSRPGNCYIA